MGGMTKLLNPIGAIAPKSGIGQWLDPAGAISRKTGQRWIDPMNVVNPAPPAKAAAAPTPRKKTSDDSENTKTGSSLLLG